MKTVAIAILLSASIAIADDLAKYNVVWTSPSAGAKGSMLMGNGDIGLNLWVEPTGDVVFFISKTDAWDENMRLVKIGKVRVRFEPALVTSNGFRQELRLRDGVAEIQTPATKVRVWVDANHPVIQVDAESLDGRQLTASASSELWRKTKQPCDPGYPNFAGPAFSWPDTVLKAGPKQTGWFHRNAASPWRENLKVQKLDALTQTERDPILGRTFGAILRGDNFVAASDTTLKTAAPAGKLSLRVHVLTRADGTAEEWQAAVEKQADAVEALPVAERWVAHGRWWDEFWNRSWIFVEGDAAAESVTRAYIFQRWINACAGRGEFPIKFNGSIFVVDCKFDADYRQWGGCYWFQNTRFAYWSMLAAGDFDMMAALFGLYMRALPARRLAAKTYYGHDGAFFPETMTIWGTYNDKNYGTNRTGKADGLTDNGFIRRYWQGGIEVIALMLDYYDRTQDARFRDSTLLPFANEIITFFDQHWPRNADGKIQFVPSQALETWWNCTDPLPEIAGLRFVIPRLQQIAGTNQWQKTLDSLPSIPVDATRPKLLPATKFSSKHNAENPELYAVFPYRLYGVGKPDLDVALEAWRQRLHKGGGCWRQDPIQAALLGLTDEAQKLVTGSSKAAAKGFRFPAFWGAGFDWMPDQDHGGVMMTALQSMLLQTDGDKVFLLPAWPINWNVTFKLHAPRQTTIEGVFRDGKLDGLKVTPETRRSDVVIAKKIKKEN